MKYLPLYYEWIEAGELPGMSGLCKAFEILGKDYNFLPKEIAANDDDWARIKYDLWFDSCQGEFNATRQNIILLLAAENNEL